MTLSGHSKWSTIKRRKAVVDAKRGKIFTKLSREIIVAARQGGGDPESNIRLKTAVQRAREANIPNDNIQRAIQKGVGGSGGEDYQEVVYEGYGPAGVAVLLEIMTDNRNRTASEIRHLFSRHGGSLGESGCVSWMFEKKGFIVVNREESGLSEDDLMLIVLDAGAEDLKAEEGTFEILCSPADFQAVRDALDTAGVILSVSEMTMIPKSTVKLKGEDAAKMMRLMDALEDHDDVQEIYANFEVED